MVFSNGSHESTNIPPTPSVWSAALFIAGASLGAGLLALPVQTGLSGLLPAVTGLIAVWALMLLTGCILADAFIGLDDPTAGLCTLYSRKLGSWSRWLVSPAFLVLFYGLLVAYISGSGSVLAALFRKPQLEGMFVLLFFLIASAVVVVGMRYINRANAGFMAVLIGSFAGLLALTVAHMDSGDAGYRDWRFLSSAVPIVLCAFAYHNVIPSVCCSLGNDRKRVRQAICCGSLLTLVINGTWMVVVLGVLPVSGGADSLLAAFHGNQPATIPLEGRVQSGLLSFFGLLFSMAALFTSYVAVGEGLRSFLADLLRKENCSPGKGWPVLFLTFVPPLVISLLYPQLFLTMLDIVGGLGVMVLFVLLPALIVFNRARDRRRPLLLSAALLLIVACTGLIALECAQEAGVLNIRPQAEYRQSG